MADKEEGQATAPTVADWEVVSLTASAYAAAPGADMAEFKGKEKGDIVDKDKVETSNTLFMSGHFVLPLEPESTETLGEQGLEDGVSEPVKQLGGKPDAKEEENWDLKKLTESDDFHGIQFSDEKGKQHNLYSSPKLDSLHNEAATRVLAESRKSCDPALGSTKQTIEDSYDESGLTYAAWWKKQAASLYTQAKETNTFWPIFVAAAVTGLVVIGQQWQQERWQVLHHDWKFGINDERMEGPISGLKDAIVGVNQRDFSIGVGNLREH